LETLYIPTSLLASHRDLLEEETPGGQKKYIGKSAVLGTRSAPDDFSPAMRCQAEGTVVLQAQLPVTTLKGE